MAIKMINMRASTLFLAFLVLQLACARAGNKGWLVDAQDKLQAVQHAAKNRPDAPGQQRKAQAAAGARSATTASSVLSADKDAVTEWWEDYKEHYNKKYKNAAAEAKARSNFVKTMKEVHAINSDPKVPFWTSGNEFADMDDKTFQATFLAKLTIPAPATGRKLRGVDAATAAAAADDDAAVQHEELGDGAVDSDSTQRRKLLGVPSNVDWAAAGKVTPVKHQGSCGCCWAFSATAAIESAYLIAKRLKYSSARIDLSEQQMVSCSPNTGGCAYGGANAGFEYAAAKSLTIESKWSYVSGWAGFKPCSSTNLRNIKKGYAIQLSSTGNVYRLNGNEGALKQAVAAQPTVVYFNANGPGFKSYRGGIYKPSSCSTAITHALLVTGYNSGQKYWTVKNSWGTGWGKAGHAQIAMTGNGKGVCGMYGIAFNPGLGFKQSLYSNAYSG